MAQMSSSRPYLIRALYEWILDNQCTPYVLVNAAYPETVVPQGFVEDGQIVLNLSPSAIRHLEMDNERISFDGRFGGQAQQVWLPAQSVMAIYARENGQGMVFEIGRVQRRLQWGVIRDGRLVPADEVVISR